MKESIRIGCVKHKCNPWFYPCCLKLTDERLSGLKVKGFYGDGLVSLKDRNIRIMFIAFRPSTARLDSDKLPKNSASRKNLLKFYEAVHELGLDNAHVTDITKCRRPARKTDLSIVELMKHDFDVECGIPFLISEVKLVKPTHVIAVDNDVMKASPFVIHSIKLLDKDACDILAKTKLGRILH